MSVNSVIGTYTRGLFSTRTTSQVWGLCSGEENGQTPPRVEGPGRSPRNIERLLPSMHTLSSLNSLRDPSRYSGKRTTHFEDDVGVVALDSVHIGRGAQFHARRIKLCCDKGFYVQKSALSIAYELRAEKRHAERQDAEQRLIQAVFLEYRALSYPPIREHPNVIDLLDLGWETDPDSRHVKWPVLILEYADQGTMTNFLARSHFSVETRVKLCLDVARGLAVIHQSGIAHRDLKMDNVLIFTNPSAYHGSISRYTAKLADFGASSVELDEGEVQPCYTRPWNAPECLQRKGLVDLQRMDIYSFGLLCWAVMLHGKDPFRDSDAVAQKISPEDYYGSVERLKKSGNGTDLLNLASGSFAAAFQHLRAPEAAITATVQLNPADRDLGRALTSLEDFLRPLR